jgi:hypothetical protein
MANRFLEGWRIAVSISDSPDLASLGLGDRHLRDVMVEVARHLISAGATLVYGGDLRKKGYTELLFEVAVRYYKASDRRPCLTDFLPWPVHIEMPPDDLAKSVYELGEHAEIIRLAPDGTSLPRDEKIAPRRARDEEWAPTLTAMRRRVTAETQAHVVLGGALEYRGRMPGIAEETLLALEARKPVYLVGGFGGCAGDICDEMGLAESKRPHRSWDMRNQFARASTESLHNGLTPEENRRLALTVHTDELVALILRGLRRVAGQEGNRVRPGQRTPP